jgi:hypothetical protein
MTKLMLVERSWLPSVNTLWISSGSESYPVVMVDCSGMTLLSRTMDALSHEIRGLWARSPWIIVELLGFGGAGNRGCVGN